MNHRLIFLCGTQIQPLDSIVFPRKSLESRKSLEFRKSLESRMMLDCVIDEFFHILVIGLEIVGRQFSSNTDAEVGAGDRAFPVIDPIRSVAVRVSVQGEDT